jgi:large subunit ribosomal protein L32
MGAVPKRKISTYRRGKRRAGKKLITYQLISCPHCGAKKLPHVLCKECGK